MKGPGSNLQIRRAAGERGSMVVLAMMLATAGAVLVGTLATVVTSRVRESKMERAQIGRELIEMKLRRVMRNTAVINRSLGFMGTSAVNLVPEPGAVPHSYALAQNGLPPTALPPVPTTAELQDPARPNGWLRRCLLPDNDTDQLTDDLDGADTPGDEGDCPSIAAGVKAAYDFYIIDPAGNGHTMLSGPPSDPAAYDVDGNPCAHADPAECPYHVWTRFRPICLNETGPNWTCYQAAILEVEHGVVPNPAALGRFPFLARMGNSIKDFGRINIREYSMHFARWNLVHSPVPLGTGGAYDPAGPVYWDGGGYGKGGGGASCPVGTIATPSGCKDVSL